MDSDAHHDVRALATGVRAVTAVFVLCLGYLGVRMAISIPRFDMIFQDMLAGHPLPLLTRAVICVHPVLAVVAIAVPGAAVLALFLVRDHKRALFITAGLAAFSFVQLVVTWSALTLPLYTIIDGMREY